MTSPTLDQVIYGFRQGDQTEHMVNGKLILVVSCECRIHRTMTGQRDSLAVSHDHRLARRKTRDRLAVNLLAAPLFHQCHTKARMGAVTRILPGVGPIKIKTPL